MNTMLDDVETGDVYSLPALPRDISAADHAIWQILLRLFARTPTEQETQLWAKKIDSGLSARQLINQLVNSKQVAKTKYVRMKNPPGHFFSPVVDPDEVKSYVDFARDAGPDDIGGISFSLDRMEEFWKKNAEFISQTPFTENKTDCNRYNYSGGPFNYGDAITARAMVNEFRPKRIVEIGSGYSSACMLDAADHVGLADFKMTCIEPYPTRLKSILRDGDRVEIIERGVQMTPLSIFSELEPNDFLFIDSTHVLKTGSDVHYELFYILPQIKPGVIVHFHDVRFPFEYSDTQVFEKNYSWNEAYGVRALLMYSERFKVFFSGSLFASQRRELISETMPLFLKNPGSSLWVEVVGNS